MHLEKEIQISDDINSNDTLNRGTISPDTIQTIENDLKHIKWIAQEKKRYYKTSSNPAVKKLGVGEYEIVKSLLNNPELDTNKAIAEATRESTQLITNSLRDLAKKGVIEISRDYKDSRRKHIRLRDPEKYEELKQADKDFIKELVRGISEPELDTFKKVADKMYDNTKNILGK